MPKEAHEDLLGDWDAVAEEELLSIESTYSKRRKRSRCSNLEVEPPRPPFDRRSDVRRLPDWGRRCTASGVAACSAPGATASASPKDRLDILPPASQVRLKIKYPAMKFNGRIIYCRTTAQVEKATEKIIEKIRDLKQSGLVSLGFDIEWKPNFRRGETPNKAAVMQICIESTNCYVMHIIHSGIPPLLKSILEDPLVVKVGVGIGNDACKVSKDYDVCVQPLEELSALANLKYGGKKQWGLSSLIETVICKQLEKPNRIRLGNWECYRLKEDQLKYAATDAYASWFLYQVLKSCQDAKDEAQTLDTSGSILVTDGLSTKAKN